MKKILCILSLLCMFSACNKVELFGSLTDTQKELIGTAVNFNLSEANPFATRVTYNSEGTFNEGDMMVIYRQYEENGSFDWKNEVFRSYQLEYKKAPGTDVVLEKNWIIYKNRKKGDYVANGSDRDLTNYLNQVEADSLTWENGKTVRFRAWARSNLSNALNQGVNNYYPDFMVSDWVTVSGPTQAIPLSMKHLGCRLFFSVRNNGNAIKSVGICLDEADYSRDDNASSLDKDDADKTILDENDQPITAGEAVAKVQAAFNKMALPAGVDIETGLLMAMTQEAYNNAKNANDASFFQRIEELAYTGDSRLVRFGTKSTADFATQAQHPPFVSNNDNFALVTIPYDMSIEHRGDPIVIPPYTRFKVTLQDVNGTGQNESTYHIFSLSDVVGTDGKAVYPNGLELEAGTSYNFKIGYRYNQMTITPGDSFGWDTQVEETGTATDETLTAEAPGTYTWWKDAIKNAIDETKNNKSYAPEFHISTIEEFLEFIRLVNGDAGKAEEEHGKLYRLVQEYDVVNNIDGTISKVPKEYGWSLVNDQKNPQFVDRSVLLEEGYVFYERYYPSDANRAAYSEEDYLRGAYSFYDEKLNRHFKVVLDADIDFSDIKIDPIGKELITVGENQVPAAFKGIFDGYSNGKAHELLNLNVYGNYLFNYVVDAAISNLKIQTNHTVGLVKKAMPTMNGDAVAGWGCYISGISVKADNQVSGVNAIAKELTGPSYVVGCIHEGDASGPLVGTASDLKMYGCMRTAPNISGAALLGAYSDPDNKFFAPQIRLSTQKANKNFSKRPTWGRFMCNYYNKDEHEDCKNAVAVADIKDDYSLLEYIRGRQSRILRSLNDNMLNRETPYDLLSDRQLDEYYGLAPWKAMNYAIYKYNKEDKGKEYPCMVHYKLRALGNGYDHTYPQLVDGKPGDDTETANVAKWDVLTQPN